MLRHLADAERSLGDLTRVLRRPSTRPAFLPSGGVLLDDLPTHLRLPAPKGGVSIVVKDIPETSRHGYNCCMPEGCTCNAALQDKRPTLGQGDVIGRTHIAWHSEVCHSEHAPGRHCSTVGIWFAGPGHGSPQPPHAVLAEQAAEIKSLKEEVDMMREAQAARRMARAPPA